MIQKLKIIVSLFISSVIWTQDCCEQAEIALDDCGGFGCYIPQCTEECMWEPMQCWGSTGYCWCVDENGVEIEGTSIPSWQGLPDCEEYIEECFDFNGIDFGACAMVLGVGLVNDECGYISGCDWTVDGVDYSNFLFESMQECEENCNPNNECNLTTDDILGPYYFEDAPFRNVIAHENEPGERLFISGIIKQNNCEDPISGSLIEIWQANDEGCYGIVEDCNTGNPDNDYFNLRGKFFSDENGNYFFESILPGYYDFRPSHVHIKITTPNEEVLISQLYFANDPYCENDTWCQDADDRIISLIENEFGLSGEIDLIINSSESGIILGDTNFDNLLNIQDIILLIGIILNNFNPSDSQIYSGDINSDNNIDILDIVQLANVILN